MADLFSSRCADVLDLRDEVAKSLSLVLGKLSPFDGGEMYDFEYVDRRLIDWFSGGDSPCDFDFGSQSPSGGHRKLQPEAIGIQRGPSDV